MLKWNGLKSVFDHFCELVKIKIEVRKLSNTITKDQSATMDPLGRDLLKDLVKTVRALYSAAPNTPFKNGREFYAAIRAMDKADLYLKGELDELIEMEREDTSYWRQMYLNATRPREEVVVEVSPAPAAAAAPAREPSPESPISMVPSEQQRTTPLLNPEDEVDDTSSVAANSEAGFLPLRPRIVLQGLLATPNLGPLLPSPVLTGNLIFQDV